MPPIYWVNRKSGYYLSSNNITSIVGKKYIAFFIHFKSARISQILHTFASVNFRNQ